MDSSARAEELRQRLREASHRYYVLDAPTLSDDTCLRKLQNGCCGKINYGGRQVGGKLVCPKGTIPHATCKSSPQCK